MVHPKAILDDFHPLICLFPDYAFDYRFDKLMKASPFWECAGQGNRSHVSKNVFYVS